MSFISSIGTAFRLARRDLRGSLKSLWLLMVGVFIGVAAVSLVGSASHSLLEGAKQGALESVGGDLSLRLYHRPPNPQELLTIKKAGEVSQATELRPMVQALEERKPTGRSKLVELKGVDQNYPLYGRVEISPAGDLHQKLSKSGGLFGAIADEALFDALGAKTGDLVKIGKAVYQLRGQLLVEPDRAFRAFTLGPRIIVSNKSLTHAGVAEEGAEAYFYTKVKLPPHLSSHENAKDALERINQAFPDSGWRLVNAHDGVPGVERALAMAHLLLLFIGLGVMLVGGAGISGAVRAHLTEKTELIAILKSLGASPQVVTLTLAFEVLGAAALGGVLGVGLGAIGPGVIATALADELPFTLGTTPSLKPLLSAFLFGLCVALLFAWWPLMRTQHTSAHILLRQSATHQAGKPGLLGWGGAFALSLVLLALIFWVSPLPLVTLAFLVGAFLLAGFYYGLGIALSNLSKRLARRQTASLRLALSNLYRAGAPTGPVVMALGLTLTLLIALDSVGEAAKNHLGNSLPQTAPDLVAFSLKADRAAQLNQEIKSHMVSDRQQILPFLHARIQAIRDIPVGDAKVPGSLNWVVRGDRGVSFAPDLPGNSKWKAEDLNQPGFSVETSVAKKLGLNPGDTLTLNVGGDLRRAPIVTFHDVDWTKLDLDFPIIATPITFKGIPFTYAASLKAKAGEKGAMEDFLKNRFPEVPLIQVADVIQSLAQVMEAIVAGLKSAALICGVAALVVLAGSVLQGLRQRLDEAILFKVLGARRRQLVGQVLVEFFCLGGLVTLAALPLGLSVAYGAVKTAGLEYASVSIGGGLIISIAGIMVTLLVGMLVTLGTYAVAPARILRDRRH